MDAASELSGGSNLFWRSCPVLVRRGDRGEERTTELTIRLIASGHKQGQRVLRLFLSSESDPYFLHLLEVGEEEYALLRQDQGIRVDFANFPGKLIGLLDKCIACKAEDLPRFQAVLQTAAGQGSLKVVENNDFKQLPHITLTLRPGSDAGIKQWLAFRLGELRGDAAQLSAELERTQSERNSLQNSLGEARRLLSETREQHERLTLECQADMKSREAAVLEAKSRELAELREAGLRERSELESKYRHALEAAQARASELEAETRSLREHKYGLDTRVSELSAKLGAAEGSNRSLREEVEQLRASSTALGRAKAERDVELGEALTKVAALEDKVAGQQGLAVEQGQRLKDMEAALRQVEARAAELKEAAQGHEARAAEAAAELTRANTMVEKLENELELQKEKVKRKAAIISRQEEELAARDKAADEAGQRVRSLQRDLERANEDAEALRREVADMRSKLEESRTAAASNEQMIRWLNSQITETQLHYGGGAAGAALLASRYSYRPAVAGAPPAAPSGSNVSTAAGAPAGDWSAPAAAGVGVAAGLAAARATAVPSTYRTPVVPSSSGSVGARPLLPSTGGSAAAGSGSVGGAAVPTRGPYRSNFYATHFGSGSSKEGASSFGNPSSTLPTAGAMSTTARSLNLGPGSLSQPGSSAAASGAPAAAAGAAGKASAPATAAPLAAKHMSSLFEAPTFRMADTAAGKVAVPVTSATS